ncbi:MAG: LLM class flavin-dependent oxidoreductase [Cryobacterium sp.]|nr:LLM class flavin-dependent oxidoreductase [Cryobacterium sp.]
MALPLGIVLPMVEQPPVGGAPSWADMLSIAQFGESVGADTVFLADEILWRDPDWPEPRGWWDCLTLAGALAASTSTIKIGTWVLSALQHQPGMFVRAAETLDEISGGRFVLGIGAGHAGGATALGFATDNAVSRYLEAVEIIVPLLRSEDPVTFEGDFHRAEEVIVRPRGPRSGRIPLMMGGHKPRTMTAAAQHADVWSAFATTSSLPEAFRDLTHQLDQICEKVGRDPASIERSVGVWVDVGDETTAESVGLGVPITGSSAEITDTLARFADVGVTRVEIAPWPPTLDAVHRLEPVIRDLT